MFNEKLNYYAQFDDDNKSAIKNDQQRTMSIYNSVVKVLYENDEGDFTDKISADFQAQMQNPKLR
jgi:mRNA-degrading endonuclease YafQ of YafQ-DinJ toxin-antitoxin module